MMLIWRDKSTIINNIFIIEDFYLKQLRIDLNDFVYN